jgi:hypothetical protein
MRTALALCLLAAALLPGCTAVKPWERATLAREDMAWDPDPVDAARRSHTFFSKEATPLAGGSAGGGGCGCN